LVYICERIKPRLFRSLTNEEIDFIKKHNREAWINYCRAEDSRRLG
jgi:hypothetical protein